MPKTHRIPKNPPGSDLTVSPLAPKKIPDLPPVEGVCLSAGSAGVKYRNRADVVLVAMPPGTQVAGVFTKSKTPSAAVEWCKRHIQSGRARALVVNSGNANAFTGKTGRAGAKRVAEAAALAVGCRPGEVLLASTGVIGEPFPFSKVARILDGLAARRAADAWKDAARAIMTTDTFPKLATRTANICGRTVAINGIAKGSGMIAPDMATMLSFVFTDAELPAGVLQNLLSAGVQNSFNAITVDSDTSTSDTLLLFATGKRDLHPKISRANDKRLGDFREKLFDLLLDLALQVVRDGEGAQKLIRVDVSGATSKAAAKRIALSIANSPLVKTAIAGGDANWGRVVMAVGKSGEATDRDKLKISFGGQIVAEDGARAARYDERAVTRAVSGRTVEIAVDIGLGRAAARIWTCDLTHGYIDINAAYRS
ncbi:MAG TPA: bifunctional glutamate N-acetyltransferase/amino-acid acetyltransferase ArgJ [Rhizomicrobium sp.]|jgi:glutamate N-acetyltransferase/amino-acid N-acetyltransferase|nr:bifunctional glutamate N-acetyltransferase/amino-acid acetyltransferase ArgJ [Rhizomicrobium sp.]